jgi:tight adherence protein B
MMGPAVLVFIVVVGLIVGAYFAITILPGRIAEKRLDERLRDVSSVQIDETGEASVVRRIAEGPLPAVDRALEGTRVGIGLSRLIEQSGVRTTPSGVVAMSVGAAIVAGLLGLLFVRQPIAAPIAAAVGAMLPYGYLRRQRSVRLKKFEEQFPEALDVLSRALRAGHAFQTAMGMAADELPEPVGPEFKKAFDQQNFGLPLREALNGLSERVPILDVRFFVTAVLIQRETGGNLAEILDNLSHVVRERFKILRQVRVHTAHGRFTGWVLLSLPAALAVALWFLNPEFMNLLFNEHLGRMLLLAAMVLQTIGYFWIRQVIKIEV